MKKMRKKTFKEGLMVIQKSSNRSNKQDLNTSPDILADNSSDVQQDIQTYIAKNSKRGSVEVQRSNTGLG